MSITKIPLFERLLYHYFFYVRGRRFLCGFLKAALSRKGRQGLSVGFSISCSRISRVTCLKKLSGNLYHDIIPQYATYVGEGAEYKIGSHFVRVYSTELVTIRLTLFDPISTRLHRLLPFHTGK